MKKVWYLASTSGVQKVSPTFRAHLRSVLEKSAFDFEYWRPAASPTKNESALSVLDSWAQFYVIGRCPQHLFVPLFPDISFLLHSTYQALAFGIDPFVLQSIVEKVHHLTTVIRRLGSKNKQWQKVLTASAISAIFSFQVFNATGLRAWLEIISRE